MRMAAACDVAAKVIGQQTAMQIPTSVATRFPMMSTTKRKEKTIQVSRTAGVNLQNVKRLAVPLVGRQNGASAHVNVAVVMGIG